MHHVQMHNIMIINLNLDFINIITYCSSILPSYLSLIFYSIIFMILSILIHYSTRWIRVIVNGVERIVPATAGALFINDALGRPIPIPNLGSKDKDKGKDNNQGNNSGNNSGNKSGNNATKSILFSRIIKPFKSKHKDLKNRQSFILPFILNILDINIPEGSENLTNYAFGVMTLSLIALLCFINVLGYFLSLYVLDKYNIETKFPKLSKIKTYYKNTTLIFIIYESLFCIFCLLFLIISAYLYLKSVLVT